MADPIKDAAEGSKWYESLPLVGGGLGFLGGLLGGGGGGQYPEQQPTNLYNVNPVGTQLHRALVARYAQGLGDYGFGRGVKQGTSQLAQIMGDRGITPDSGVYQQAESNMLGQAMAAASQNRQNYGLQLAGMPMQVMGASGQNQAYGDDVWNSQAMQAIGGMMPGYSAQPQRSQWFGV